MFWGQEIVAGSEGNRDNARSSEKNGQAGEVSPMRVVVQV